MKSTFLSFVLVLIGHFALAEAPLKLAIAGLSHGHVDWIFNRADKQDVVVVGIYETNPVLIDRYAKQYHIDKSLFFTKLQTMLDEVKPEAVSAFGAINEHITVVRACAPRKIHVMVEKPLATTRKDAKEMQQLAQQHQIHVLTHFETSWYESNQQVKALLDKGALGQIRKVLVNDGHQGPKEIGVSPEFFAILTDPEKNGAGALVDFGCYGSNLMSWLMRGERPISVSAVTQQHKPDIYQQVDDEATIVLQYAHAQCVIQGSWNWPFSRKDMEVYGSTGYALAPDATTLRYRLENQPKEQLQQLTARAAPYDDPFSLLAAVVKGKLQLDEFDQYGLPVNILTVEILEAAKIAAQKKQTIFLDK